MADSPLVALLAAGGAVLDAPVHARLAADVSAPLRVGVAGRPGAGRDTVRRALRGAGAVVAEPGEPADIDVRVCVETLTGADVAAISAGQRPAVAVLNKADLSCFRGAGPMAVAAQRCRELERGTGVPTLPLAALLAVAASDPAILDRALIGGLGAVLVEPQRLTSAIRRRLLAELDLFGIAVAAAAVCDGADRSALAVLLRGVSGLPAVLDAIDRAGAPIRYRRLVDALNTVAEVASGDRVAEFLAGDTVVLARMASAAEVVGAPRISADSSTGCADHLRRAIHWRRYAQGPVSELHRACGADIARGALRLWSQAGGIPETIP